MNLYCKTQKIWNKFTRLEQNYRYSWKNKNKKINEKFEKMIRFGK